MHTLLDGRLDEIKERDLPPAPRAFSVHYPERPAKIINVRIEVLGQFSHFGIVHAPQPDRVKRDSVS